MVPDRRKQLRVLARVMMLGLVLGLASGYVIFYAVFPIVSVPATSDSSLLYIVLILSSTALIVGLATEDLVQVIFQAFVALFLSGVFATAIGMTPMLVGVAFLAPDELPAYFVHFGFLLFLLGFVVDFLGGMVGLALRERYFFRGKYAAPAPWQRK